MLHPKNPKTAGMILTEALVSIAALAIGAIALGSITSNAVYTTILSKDYLVIEGLLNEGDEIVKNIRYANWLLKPSDETCWLRLIPDNSADGGCGSNVLEGKNYILVLKNGIWQMELIGGTDLNLNKQQANFRFQIYLGSDNAAPGYFAASAVPVEPSISKSKFFRSIKFTEVASGYSTATYAVKIQWKEGAKTREVIKNTTLYNYL